MRTLGGYGGILERERYLLCRSLCSPLVPGQRSDRYIPLQGDPRGRRPVSEQQLSPSGRCWGTLPSLHILSSNVGVLTSPHTFLQTYYCRGGRLPSLPLPPWGWIFPPGRASNPSGLSVLGGGAPVDGYPLHGHLLYGHSCGGGGSVFCVAVPSPYPYPGLLNQGGIGREEGLQLRPRRRCAASEVLL